VRFRYAAVPAALCVSGAAPAQTATAVDIASRAIRYYGLEPGPPSVEPTGRSNQGEHLPDRIKPTGVPPSQGPVIEYSATQGTTSKDGILHFENGFEAEYKGYRMTGDVLDGNRHSDVYVISGNARLVGPDATVTADRILVDYRNKTYEAWGEQSQLRPTLVGGILQTDVYSKAEHGNGSEAEQFIHNGYVTTCNYADPHYYLYAKNTDVRFERRIVFHDLDVVVLGKELVHLPFLAVPLDQNFYNNLPVIGQDPYEGYFIKTRYGIPMKGDAVLYTRFDYMTLLGIGAGLDYQFNRKTGKNPLTSDVSIYGVTGSQTIDINQAFDQTYGWGRFQMQNSYQGHDYQTAPQNDILNSRESLSFKERGGVTSLSYTTNSNTGPGFDSKQDSFTVAQAYQRGPLKVSSNATYTDSASTYSTGASTQSVDRKEIDVDIKADEELRKATATLDYVRTIPIGQNTNFFGATDQTPNLVLTTDGQRLFGNKVGLQLPFKTDLAFGQFADPQTQGEVTRDRFDVAFDKNFTQGSRSSLQTSGQFSQSFYSDDTAQYAVGLNTTYSYRLGKDTAFNVRYNYLRPEGYSPLGIDLVGSTNVVSEDVSVRPWKPFLIGVEGSYDFLQAHMGNEPWSPFGLRAEYQPRTNLLIRSDATYDPFYKGIANTRLDVTYQPGKTFVGFGARYDNTRSAWAEIDFYINAFKIGRVTSDIRMSYNGYTDTFNSIQLSLTYDLHCAELVFQLIDNPIGFESGQQLSLFLRIKGLPFNNGFGTGTRGQGYGYGTGAGY
jgi:LPS-assembly protein